MSASDMLAIVSAIVSGLVACTLIVTLIVLYRKGMIGMETIETTADLLESLQIEDGFVASLAKYAVIAVRAVEQLVKTGKLEKNNQARQQEAIAIVKELAAADGLDVRGTPDVILAAIVDAEVHDLPRNN